MQPRTRGLIKRWFEYSAQVLVFYSIIVLYMEAESHSETGFAAEFWRWNERMLLGWFLFEYVARWVTSRKPWQYPVSLLGMIDLLAILPALVGLGGSFRSLKLLRALRMLRLLKLYRYNHALQNVIHGFRRVGHELAVVGFVAVTVLLTSSLAVFEFEHDTQPEKFRHLWDALWWSFVSLTTVGYGDLVPVTIGGRLIGILTMLIGIGIFGTFISLVGSSFLTTMREEQLAAEAGRVEGEAVEESAPWTEPEKSDPVVGDMPG